MPADLERSFKALRTAALAYPEAHEDFPWGHCAIKVKNKIFVSFYLDTAKPQLSLSTKLPQSNEFALLLPFASPTGYGLARSGWVTAAFGPQDDVPLDMLRGWIDESFRAVAPTKLTRQLTAQPTTKSTARATTSKPSTAKPSKPSAKSSTTKPTRKPTTKPASKTGRARSSAR